MNGGRPCNRPLFDLTHCICHSVDPNKDKEAFVREIEKVVSNTGERVFDFSSFVFNVESPLRNNNINRPLLFKKCKFIADFDYSYKTNINRSVNFDLAIFYRSCSFAHATFHENVSFCGTEFKKHHTLLDLSNCNFLGTLRVANETKINRVFLCDETKFEQRVSFSNTTFHKAASFSRLEVNSLVDVIGCRFEEVANFQGIVIKDSVSFRKCHFLGLTVFNGCDIQDELILRHCVYAPKQSFAKSMFQFNESKVHHKGRLLISDCSIHETSSFAGSLLDGTINFHNTVFHGFVDMSFVRIGKLSFDAAGVPHHRMFESGISLFGIRLSEESILQFRHIDLRTARFVETPMEAVEFIASRWGKPTDELGDERHINSVVTTFKNQDKNAAHNASNDEFQRFGLHYEDDISHAYIEVAQVYRRLQQKYLDYIDPFQAGVFHQKEMKMVQQAIRYQIHDVWVKGKRWGGVKGVGLYLLYTIYNHIFRYGESIGLPAFYLTIILLGTPALLLFLGVSVDGNHIQYILGMPQANLLEVIKDYFTILREVVPVLWFRSHASEFAGWAGWILFVEQFLAPFFLTFLILAIRRRFKRKSY